MRYTQAPLHNRVDSARLFFIGIFILGVVDVEVTQFVGRLVRGNHVQVVTQLLLLQVLLGQVLQVALGERGDDRNVQLGLFAGDLDNVAQDTGLAVHFDAVVQELFERGNVQNLVIDWDRAVNGELQGGLLARLLGLLVLRHCKRRFTTTGERCCCIVRRSSTRSLSSPSREENSAASFLVHATYSGGHDSCSTAKLE
ncbi:hypothetical protein Ae201684P_008727 [Aphanomyces euteiches]|nr:hypothetical protein Ae201684P_008727 [Aphanomyces euteiches]